LSDHALDFICRACTADLDACLYEGKSCEGCTVRHAVIFDDEGNGHCRACKGQCQVCGILTAPGAKHCSECAAAHEASLVGVVPLELFAAIPTEVEISRGNGLLSRGVA
jgi:hypothetical protein